MKKFFLAALVFSSIVCFSQSAKVNKQSFDKFIEIEGSNVVMVPIDWDNNAKIGDMKIMGSRRTKNILFYNSVEDSHRFLFQDSLQIIVSYSGQVFYRMYQWDTVKTLNNDHLYYTVINKDYNEDNRLDPDDPSYLYYSKIDGSDLTLLTPENYHLKYYKYIKTSNIILATLVQDENNDKKFDNKDSEVLYKIDLNDFNKSRFVAKLKLKEKT